MKSPESGFSGQIVAALFGRLLLNTARRFAYPFAPALSRGLEVPLTAVTSLIAVNQVTALLGILSGPLADRFGYRLMMLLGMGMLVVGMLAGGLLPFYGVILVSLFLAGLGKSVFDPALQAYVGRRVPIHRRGRVIGILEMCWAGSTLVGIPLVGLLMDRMGWRSPFFAIGGLGLLGLWVLWRLFRRENTPGVGNGREPRTSAATPGGGVFAAWGRLARNRAAMGALGFGFFISLGNDNLFVVYGAWLESAFGLSILAIGVGTSVIGGAELLGELLTAAVADRLGLVRSVMIGLVLNTVCYAALPFFGQSLPMALTGLFCVFVTLEFTIVSTLTLCTEIVPGARATMMSAFLAAAGLGRVAGALLGGPIWMTGGIEATSQVSTAAGLLALACLVFGIGWKNGGNRPEAVS